MFYKSDKSKSYQEYVPPVLGNGNMAFQVDYEGCMQYTSGLGVIKQNPDLKIWWAGRRYLNHCLIPFGRFEQRVSCGGDAVKIKSYSQELDVKNAAANTECHYSGGVDISTSVIIHHDYNLIAVNKTFDCKKNIKYCFDYRLCGTEDGAFPELMNLTFSTETDGSITLRYKIPSAMLDYNGVIRLFCDSDAAPRVKGNVFSLESDINGRKSMTFYILFCDSVDDKNYFELSEKIRNKALNSGFSEILKEHSMKWNEYFKEGYAITDNEEINNAYNTAQYHLKCYTTKWSLPVGLSDTLWHGRYFAFDEFYMLMALLTSNHLNAAERIPKFRAKGLKKAVKRGSAPINEPAARYPWETLETGEEGSSSGYWHDHVFHMACIACGGYYYYKFSGDKEFLKETAYPVIKSCALFYINHMLYETKNGGLTVGKCTDLERLGSSVENPYMTACGVIKTLNILSETAKILGVDLGLADECRKKARLLLDNLPNDGKKYVPYPDCKTVSIGLMSGVYPFDVIAKDSKMQELGIKSYLDSEKKNGNMYAVGSGVCSWYLTWKALVFARLGKGKETLAAVTGAVKTAGNFSEMYEINDIDTNTVYRPWFATAAGMLIHSVNEMLLQCKDGEIYIAPAVPESMKSFSFKLAAYNGLTVEASVENNCIKRLNIICGKSCTEEFVRVVIPSRMLADKTAGDNTSIKVRLNKGERYEYHN